MIRPALILSAALIAFPAATAANETQPEENRERAALVEWTMANCTMDGVPAFVVAMASMISNGSTPEQMEAARGAIRAKISEHYADAPTACAAIKASWAQ